MEIEFAWLRLKEFLPSALLLITFQWCKTKLFLEKSTEVKNRKWKKKLCASCIHKLFVVATYKINTVLEKIFWWKGLLTWSIGVHSPMLELFIFLSPLSTQKTRWNLPGSWRAYSTHRFSIHHGETERCLRSFVIGLLKHEASSKPLVLCVYTKSDSSSETHEDSVLTEILTE